MDIEKKILELEQKIDSNKNELINNMNRLHNQEKQIQKNTVALEILHAMNVNKKKLFATTLIILTILICSLGLNVFLIFKVLF